MIPKAQWSDATYCWPVLTHTSSSSSSSVHQPKLPNHESRRLITKMVCSASRHASQCVATTMYSARRKIEIVASVSEIRVRQRLTRRDERTRRTSLSKRVVLMILTILICIRSPPASIAPVYGRMSKTDGKIDNASSVNQPRR